MVYVVMKRGARDAQEFFAVFQQDNLDDLEVQLRRNAAINALYVGQFEIHELDVDELPEKGKHSLQVFDPVG